MAVKIDVEKPLDRFVVRKIELPKRWQAALSSVHVICKMGYKHKAKNEYREYYFIKNLDSETKSKRVCDHIMPSSIFEQHYAQVINNPNLPSEEKSDSATENYLCSECYSILKDKRYREMEEKERLERELEELNLKEHDEIIREPDDSIIERDEIEGKRNVIQGTNRNLEMHEGKPHSRGSKRYERDYVYPKRRTSYTTYREKGYRKELIDIYTTPVTSSKTTKVDLNVYPYEGEVEEGYWVFSSDFTGITEETREYTNKFRIFYKTMGMNHNGVILLLIPGVPTNAYIFRDMDYLLAKFLPVVCIDPLGMGRSSKPMNYGENEGAGDKAWHWIYHAKYISQMMSELFPGRKYFPIGFDWGGGIVFQLASIYPTNIVMAGFGDPVALDGYPVSEIQAIGRASLLEMNEFRKEMSSFDSTMVQILKSMVKKPSKWNQFTLRDIKRPYMDVGYDSLKEPKPNSLNMRLKFHALRVLSQMAAQLAPYQLLPYDEMKNPLGVKYEEIKVPVLIMWGTHDNMMPPVQKFTLRYLLKESEVCIYKIHKAGHFIEVDKPKEVSENILNFVCEHRGFEELAGPFFGFKELWKGNEEELAYGLYSYYNFNQ